MNSLNSNSIQLEDQSIHYLSAGTGEVILFLHGWPTSADLWRNIMPSLSGKYRTIAMDLPGFGKSDKRAEDSYSFNYYSRAIDGLLDRLGVEKLTLCVHDLGGPIGLYWAIKNMDRVDGLILLNTLVYPEMSWGVKLFGFATVMPGIRHWISSPAGIKWAMNFGVNQKDKLTPEAVGLYQQPFKDKAGRKALLKTVQRLSPKGFVEIAAKLPQFQKPVLIIYGAQDRILPKVKNTMERVKKDLPHSQVEILPDCGHFIQEEEPEKIAGLIKEFMK